MPRLLGVCDRAEPAAAFDAFDVRPSRSTFDAAFAAFGPVTFFEFAIVITAFLCSALRRTSRRGTLETPAEEGL